MKIKNGKNFFMAFMFVIFAVFITANVALAQDPTKAKDTFSTNPANTPVGPDGGIGSNDPTSSIFQLVTCSGVDDPRTEGIEKECNYEQLIAMVSRLIKFALYILIPIVLGMILFIGFKYLTANGDSGKLADAKRMITPLFIGIILIFAAWLIVYTFLDKILIDGLRKDIIPAGIK